MNGRDQLTKEELLKARRIEKLLGELYPEELGAGERQQLSLEVVRLVRRSRKGGWDLTNATLLTKGAKKSPIGTRLQELRVRAGFTQEEVSQHARWHAAKVTRIESGRVPITYLDLRFLLDLYGVRDKQLADDLAMLAAQDRIDRTAHRRKAS